MSEAIGKGNPEVKVQNDSQNKNGPEHGYVEYFKQGHAKGDGGAPDEGVPA